MIKINELSIFFPFWNEEKNIEKVVNSAIPIADIVAKNWEILIIDDGSSDKTLEKAKELEKNNKNENKATILCKIIFFFSLLFFFPPKNQKRRAERLSNSFFKNF
mgnify:CR=1 FL=1